VQTIAILGAGAGGTAAAVELQGKGYEVRLWNRSEQTLAPLRRIGGVEYEGVLGEGRISIARIDSDLKSIVAGADAALVCLPTFIHGAIARDLAALGFDRPIVLNPGHTGGALEFRHAWLSATRRPPELAEFSTLTYVARKQGARVHISGAAKQVRLGALPGADAALEAARRMYASASPVDSVLVSDLSNANLILHPPAAVLAAAWIEATRGDFTFYVQGATPGVGRVMGALDGERQAVAAAFGYSVVPLLEEMKAIGTVEPDTDPATDIVQAISGGAANRRIKAPDSFSHRYYREDFGFGLVPFIELATIAGVPVPTADALLTLACRMTGEDYRSSGRNAERMGIAGLDRAGLKQLVS